MVCAIEPDRHMMRRAIARARTATARVELVRASAERLPFRDRTFDTAVSTLVLCTVPDPTRAAREILRALKPGGGFCIFEHVRYQGRVGGALQDAADPFWLRLFGGCRPNRDLAAVLLGSGFDIGPLRIGLPAPPIPPFLVVRPHISGVLRAM